MAQQKWANGSNSSSKYVTDQMLAPFITSHMPTSQVEMTLSSRNLIDMDVLSKSDPFCIVSMKEPWQTKYFEVGRTEVIYDNLNPEWAKKFVLNFNFETVQKMKFELWDEDQNGQDFLGMYETTLADIVSFSGRQFTGNLTGIPGRVCGQIIIVVEEVASCKQIVNAKFSAKNLTKQSWFVSNDPFLVISRANEDNSYSVVTRTETVNWTQNPVWRPVIMRATTLCNGDYDRSIKIDCYDYRSSGSHKLIGSCHTSLRLLTQNNEKHLPLVNAAKQRSKRTYTNSGMLDIISIELIEEPSFLDFIKGGTQMHFAVAIDFTGSNGAPSDPNSLHYLDMHRPNCYEIALKSVGDIIEHYDSSKLYPAFGFGAKIPPSFEVSHQFPLNGQISHPYCANIEEILTHYRNRLHTVQLYGPTNFAPVINNTITIARQFQDGKHYFVLLIITDGIISDMHQTKNAIINASCLPISIIIVGVGNAEFDEMDELDSDDVRLSVDGRYADRDIVQFVPLNKFLSKQGPYIKSQADLAKEVLEEIPDQMTGYMKSKGFKPDISKPQNPILPPTAPMG